MPFEIKILIVLFVFCFSLFLKDKTQQMAQHTKNYDVFVRDRLKHFKKMKNREGGEK